MRFGLVLTFAIMLLLGISSIVPGCMNSQETSFTPVHGAGDAGGIMQLTGMCV